MGDIDLEALVRNIPDFPKPGIQFKDITTLLCHGPAFRQVIDTLVERYGGRQLDTIVGIESRGFIFGAPLAYEFGIGFVPVRKPGKLPAETYQIEYALEYGTNSLEIHCDALKQGARVLIIDDLLATGGTVAATAALVEQAGGVVEEIAFVIELSFLGARQKLEQYPVYSMIQYD
ncbi:MAG: adenine phosphoribosyltransferase [Chloroflexaceae bacterium]|nr:adenine phosphoribosyltransferase [Chloroflexaceae bacterium]